MTTLEEDIKRFESWQKLEDLFEYASCYNIHIVKAKYTDKRKPGIHLIDPNYNELNEAIAQSAVNSFNTIWCHNKVQFNLKLIKGNK